MSSHHFVKEGQEPALFIVDALSLSQAEPLLEWAPLVLISDASLDEVLLWGIKIDVILTSHPESAILERVAHQQPISIVRYQADEDFVKVGIEFLQQKKSSAVNVMADMSVEAFSTAHADLNFQCSLLNDEARWSLIRKRHFEKWLDAGSQLFIYTQHPHDVQFEALTADASNRVLTTPQAGVVRIKSNHDFWIGEPF